MKNNRAGMTVTPRSSYVMHFSLLATALMFALAPTASVRAQGFGGGGGGRGAPPASNPSDFVGGGRTSVGVAAGGRGGAPAGRGAPTRGGGALTPGEGPTAALDAIIYDVRMPAQQIGRLDLDSLPRAAGDIDAFEKALGALGTSVPLYRTNQVVRLAFDSVNIGAQVPYVTGSAVNRGGQVTNSVSYSSVGALFDLAGKMVSPSSVELDMSMQVSVLSEGATAISNDVKAPMFRTVTLVHKGPVEPNKPFVVVGIDGSAVDANGKAIAYIARVTLGTPQLPVSSARGN